MRIEKRRAPSFPKAPFLFDGDKPNSVPSPSFVDEFVSRFASATKLELSDDHLSSSPSFASDASKIDIFIRETGAGRVPQARDRVRRYPRIDGPAVLPLFCLAPHGVFPASRITPRAVSSYLAISPLPAPRRGKLTASLYCQRTGGIFSVTLSVTAILQPRRPRFLRGMLPYGVRTFLQRILRFTSDHLPSARNLAQLSVPRTKDTKVTMSTV
jgi:hypothetical protein